MEDTRTDLYKETMANFENAIDDEDSQKAQENYDILVNLIHPNNHLKKILNLSLISVGGTVQDD